ncbi:hypothetical protein [Flavilitoribacter nigricans]|uniref:Uncharacterized protein n=1 Tax=Flavilitoribacter nigricans (strain ATCC 23147 / DSM 23189 / NBRC 102662 / NCIMB 1420 / SS-2) TaxID=1122177 RepID=A0A2D0NAA1_FLAN2|nr:hypothetical protein [Flavilitoribacter nigricans]PHN05407.1 hypothetical protein CRP01_15530 [Flavilitoribacter nigricans DSM 23189 = NBRC 102662]
MNLDTDSDGKDFGNGLGPVECCDLLIEKWENFLSKNGFPNELPKEKDKLIEFSHDELLQLGQITIETLKLVRGVLSENENPDDDTLVNMNEDTLQAIAKALEIIGKAIATYEALAHLLQ